MSGYSTHFAMRLRENVAFLELNKANIYVLTIIKALDYERSFLLNEQMK
jgi:hypothetical protein